MAKNTCECGPANFIWIILAAIVLGIGVWLLVGGLQMQWTGMPWLNTLLWYAAGILVLCIGKCFKMKACSGCPMHSMK